MTNNKHKTIYGGLNPQPEDKRDFSLGGVFGSIDISEVPTDDFIIADPIIATKDQKNTDFCTAYAATSSSEKQEGIELSPEYQFNSTKVISGKPDEWGAQLRHAAQSLVKYGSVPQEEADKLMEQQGFDKYDRNIIAKTDSWRMLDEIASEYKKQSYFRVDGNNDNFDNIRAALWKHRDEKRTIITGCLWRKDWNDLEDGVIPKEITTDQGFGHAFEIIGQKNINGELHLVAQLSNGESIGDNGKFYLPRDIVNAEIGNYGVYMFKDLPREEAQYYNENGIQYGTAKWIQVIIIILNILKEIFRPSKT